MYRSLIFVLGLWGSQALCGNFSRYLRDLDNHAAAKQLEKQSLELSYQAISQASWPEPSINIAVKNTPPDDLSTDSSPMSGIEFKLQQKLPLTSQHSLEKDARLWDAKGKTWQRRDLIRKLQFEAWNNVIQWHKKNKELQVLENTNRWLEKKISITKSLYANGQATQQGILELQIRRSDIQSLMVQRKFEKISGEESLKYLFGDNFNTSKLQVSWGLLAQTKQSKESPHAGEQAILANAKAMKLKSQLQRVRMIPHLSVGLAYTKRSDIYDSDLVSISIGLPLPITGQRSADYEASIAAEHAANFQYQDYKHQRKTKVAKINNDIRRILEERKIIAKQTLSFAEASLEIVSKSYGIGNASYIELLSAQISLQDVQLRDISLWAELQTSLVKLKYLKGDQLY